MAELGQRKRVRVDSDESEFEAKRLREDLLSLLDDSDPAPERDSVSHDLDSVIRSFEEEITGSGSRSSPVNFVDLTSDSGEFLPELGQFSGNDVGLLKETETLVGDGSSELIRVPSESSGVGEFWDFPSYDSFGLTIGYEQEHGSSDYVALDGIFDHSDVNFGSDFLWRPDTLPAI